MAKSKNKSNVPFIVAASLLGVSVIIPVVLLIVSVLSNDKATHDLTKTLYPLKYEDYVEKYSSEFGVDKCLVYGVIRNESNFNPNAVSPVGAIGLMQLMPDTFEWLQNYRTDFMPDKLLDSKELYDPETNIEYGVYFLSYLLEKYGGDRSLAICAYNAGHGNVDKWIADGTIPSADVEPEDIPFPETSNYLAKVSQSAEMYKELYFVQSESDINAVSTQADTTCSDIESFTESGEDFNNSENDVDVTAEVSQNYDSTADEDVYYNYDYDYTNDGEIYDYEYEY